MWCEIFCMRFDLLTAGNVLPVEPQVSDVLLSRRTDGDPRVWIGGDSEPFQFIRVVGVENFYNHLFAGLHRFFEVYIGEAPFSSFHLVLDKHQPSFFIDPVEILHPGEQLNFLLMANSSSKRSRRAGSFDVWINMYRWLVGQNWRYCLFIFCHATDLIISCRFL